MPTTTCSACKVDLPFRQGDLTTCPRCAPKPDVASRIAAELVEAALATSDSSAARELLASAEAWRRVV